MPRFLYKNYNNDLHLMVWHITETVEELQSELPSSILKESEYGIIKIETKLREFLSSRLLINNLSKLLTINILDIKKDEFGKPFLVGSDYQMSLTHSKDFVAVVLHKSLLVGVDIEIPNPKMWKILTRLFTEKEQNLIKNNIKTMSIFWSAKEALYKLYGKRGIDFKENLFISSTTDNQFEGLISKGNLQIPAQLFIEKIENYILVIALEKQP